MPPILPPEIVDEILKSLPGKSQLACALVCKDWVPRARYHFFQNFCLVVFGKPKSWLRSFSTSILNANNTISPCIQKLSIAPNDRYTVKIIEVVLRAGILIRSLEVYLRDYETKFDEERLNLVSRSFPDITSLTISWQYGDTEKIASFVDAYPHLRDMSLQVMNNHYSGHEALEVFKLPPKLKKLTLSFCDSFPAPCVFEWLSSQNLPELDGLHVHRSLPSDTEHLQCLLNKMGKPLHHLSIHIRTKGWFLASADCGLRTY
jgi:hypothetical protein